MRPAVSVLQLDTQFPRVPGDVGCPDTYREEIEIIRVVDATVNKIVTKHPHKIAISPFEDAVRKARGEVIVTSCGFLSYWQDHLAACCGRPFISSALLALDHLSERWAPDKVMILTFDQDCLTSSHLRRHSGFARSIVGLPSNLHLRGVIEQDLDHIDQHLARQQLVDLALERRNNAHRQILLECTNFPPYGPALQQATKLPVSSILTEIERIQPNTIHPDYLT